MRNLFLGLAVFFFALGGAVAQHGHVGGTGHSPHTYAAPQQPHTAPAERGGGYGDGGYHAVPPQRGQYRGGYGGYQGYHGYRGGYGGWYAGRSEYRGFRWGHYYGWHYRPYMYIGANYCYPGVWGAPYFTFGFNASRWRVLDFDLGIVNGWYPGSCAYVDTDPYHYGWYLIYDEQTGQYVHAEQY